MPISYSIDREHRLLEVRYSGRVTKQDILDYFLRVELDPRGVQGFDALVDFADSFPRLSTHDIRELAWFVRQRHWPRSRRALVATDDRAYGDLRKFETLAEAGPLTYRVFKTADEACAWLGLTHN